MPAAETTPAVRLSVWRPVRWSHRSAFLDAKAGTPIDSSSFHESIYSWVMQDSPVDAVEDAEQGDRMKQEIFEAFLPERAPADRGIAVLHAKLAILDEILADSPVPWMDTGSPSAQSGAPDEDAAVTARSNRLLAFRNMLQWVCDTFRDVPEANVTLR